MRSLFWLAVHPPMGDGFVETIEGWWNVCWYHISFGNILGFLLWGFEIFVGLLPVVVVVALFRAIF
jgi:hypothetical protein